MNLNNTLNFIIIVIVFVSFYMFGRYLGEHAGVAVAVEKIAPVIPPIDKIVPLPLK